MGLGQKGPQEIWGNTILIGKSGYAPIGRNLGVGGRKGEAKVGIEVQRREPKGECQGKDIMEG